ncbi:DUF1772 domain-containing protein [Plantactinospora sp. WMMB782]|uniref:anthrone oxygenase family protein n=1 Tax=Plantactinospora sp. WMMB782 TaxID=3404121 RepID=UPI003B94C0CA
MFTGIVLGGAAMTTGLVAGVFVLYAHTIMPGLGRTDDRTFVGAFQAVDRAIINPWFMSCFFGAPILTGASAVLHLRAGTDGGLPWIAAAFLLYLAVLVITLAVNVPANDTLKAAGDPDGIADLARVRRDFGEARWRAWNLLRVVLTGTAFGCLLVALVSYGRQG